MFNGFGWEKKLVVAVFAFVFVAVAIAGVMLERTVGVTRFGTTVQQFDAAQPVQYIEGGSVSAPSGLHAVVKGSIYETGSNMTVFGACFDGDGYPLPGAATYFTAWYPNGTVMIGPNATMDKIFDDYTGNHPNGTGRWKIHVTMVNTIGTYLTEMRCSYGGENAFAYGEWQNPEWVKRIGDAQNSVANMSVLLGNVSNGLIAFRNDAQNNFSTVMNALNSLNVSINSSGGVDAQTKEKLKEIYNQISNTQTSFWVLDARNPTYSLGSGMNNWDAVDMISDHAVYAVSGDGTYQYWDGNVWTYGNYSNVHWWGVGMLDANAPYAWLVGERAGQAVYSINGAAPVVFNQTGDAVIYDVKMVRVPNAPSGATYVILSTDKGIYESGDLGANWTLVQAALQPAAMLSEIVSNLDLNATEGFRYADVSGNGNLYYWNGVLMQVIAGVDGRTYQDVELTHDGLGYVTGSQGGHNKVWKFENGTLIEVYRWDGAQSQGITAPSRDDVWIVTTDPSVFYHYNGFNWQYSSFPYSRALTITIGFGNTTILTGLHDVVMSDEFTGYAVGDDGLILKFVSGGDRDFELLQAILNASFSSVLNGQNATNQLVLNNTQLLIGLNQTLNNLNFTPIINRLAEVNLTTQQVLQIVQSMNLTQSQMQAAMAGNFSSIEATLNGVAGDMLQQGAILAAINATVNSIQSGIVQVNTTVNGLVVTTGQINATANQVLVDLAALNSTLVVDMLGINNKLDQMNASMQYKLDNVLSNVTYTQLYLETTINPALGNILTALGLIDAKLNMTISLQNQTLNLVNQSNTKLDILLNQTAKPKVRAWVTQ